MNLLKMIEIVVSSMRRLIDLSLDSHFWDHCLVGSVKCYLLRRMACDQIGLIGSCCDMFLFLLLVKLWVMLSVKSLAR